MSLVLGLFGRGFDPPCFIVHAAVRDATIAAAARGRERRRVRGCVTREAYEDGCWPAGCGAIQIRWSARTRSRFEHVGGSAIANGTLNGGRAIQRVARGSELFECTHLFGRRARHGAVGAYKAGLGRI